MREKHLRSSLGIGWIIGGISLLAVVALIFVIFSSSSSPNAKNTPADTKKSNREVALSCTLDMYTQFHIHPHLQIIINGQPQVIPANIGIVPNCLHPIHTHDDTGIIHVESPIKRDFTLADFFAVWQKQFNKNQILDYKVDNQHVIKETLNGNEVQGYENTVLRDMEQIVVSYEENPYSRNECPLGHV